MMRMLLLDADLVKPKIKLEEESVFLAELKRLNKIVNDKNESLARRFMVHKYLHSCIHRTYSGLCEDFDPETGEGPICCGKRGECLEHYEGNLIENLLINLAIEKRDEKGGENV